MLLVKVMNIWIRTTFQLLASLTLALLLVGWTFWSPVTIGNDYVMWPFYGNLLQHFYATKNILTIWYPFYTGGFPFGAIPGIQVFNLGAWLLTLIPDYTEGYAIYWNSIRYLLVFTVMHFLTARFLCTFMRMRYYYAFFLCAPLIYNFRTLDQLRYGVYLEAPFYLLAATMLAIWYLRERKILSLVFLSLFIQFALTSGHPPSIFYSVVTACLILLFAVPQIFRSISLDKKQLLISTFHLICASLVGFLLAAPNWLPASEALQMNSARVQNSTIEWSRDIPLDWSRLFSNFFVPWEVEVHSAFAGSTLYTILLIGLIAFCVRHLRHFWWALILLLFPIVYSFGGTLFELFYYYVPGFKWIRIPGRFLAMQPFHFIAVGIVGLATVNSMPASISNYAASLKNSMLVAAGINLIVTALVLAAVFCDADWLNFLNGGGWTPQKILGWEPSLRYLWLVTGIISTLIVLSALRSKTIARPKLLVSILLVLFSVQAFVTNRYGSWISNRVFTPRTSDFAGANHLPFYHTDPLTGVIALDEVVGGMATTGYTRFMKSSGGNAECFLPIPHPDWSRKTMLPFFLTRNLVLDSKGSCAANESEQVKIVQSVNCIDNPGSLIVAETEACQKIEPNNATQDLVALNSRNRLIGLSPFSATLITNAPNASILVTPYPWVQGFWKVEIDKKPAQGFEIDAGMLGVLVPGGKHKTSIQYISTRSETARQVVFYTALAVILLGLFLVLHKTKTRKVSVNLVLFLGLAGSFVLLCYTYDWASSYQKQLTRKLLLPNNYPMLLNDQLDLWEQAVKP